MLHLNVVNIAGNITKKPEAKMLEGDKCVCNFSVAINKRYTNSSGEKKEETCFVDVTAWGKVAENVSKYLDKGSNVMIEGSLITDSWTKDDKTHTKLKVTARNVHFVSMKKKDGEQSPHHHNHSPVVDPDPAPF